jgi:hypothetical protein
MIRVELNRLNYSEVPEVFANSNQVPRTSSSLLPPLATPLLRRCTPAAGVSAASLAMYCALVAPRRHLQLLATPRVDPNPSAALASPPWPSRARHADPQLCRRHLAVAVALPVRAPSPHLFWFKSSTTSLSSYSIPVSAL